MPGRQGFLLAEDEALKVLFSGMSVLDDRNATRPVQVFFRYPDNVTERTYPFITLEALDVVHATNRQHSDQSIYGWVDTPTNPRPPHAYGPAWVDYWPDETDDLRTAETAVPITNPVYVAAEEFVPVDLLYQISTYSRSALHDRELSSRILRRKIPFRRGFLDVPADNTRRYLSLLDWITADLLDQESGYRKRIFRKIYTISVTAELPSTLLYGVGRVQTVNHEYQSLDTGQPL